MRCKSISRPLATGRLPKINNGQRVFALVGCGTGELFRVTDAALVTLQTAIYLVKIIAFIKRFFVLNGASFYAEYSPDYCIYCTSFGSKGEETGKIIFAIECNILALYSLNFARKEKKCWGSPLRKLSLFVVPRRRPARPPQNRTIPLSVARSRPDGGLLLFHLEMEVILADHRLK